MARGDIANQIQRAALSITNNIAEGFERGTTRSAGEVRSILAVMEQMSVFNDLKFQISNLKLNVEKISHQLRGWTNSLQNTNIQGQRYLNDRSKKTFEQKKEREEFSINLLFLRDNILI